MMACQGNLPLPFSDASRLIGHESKAKFLVTHHHYTTKNEAEKEDDNALANLISVQNKLGKVVDKWKKALLHSTPAEMDHCTYPF